jgi:hypothetical protein
MAKFDQKQRNQTAKNANITHKHQAQWTPWPLHPSSSLPQLPKPHTIAAEFESAVIRGFVCESYA